jgi:hypothetical protein
MIASVFCVLRVSAIAGTWRYKLSLSEFPISHYCRPDDTLLVITSPARLKYVINTSLQAPTNQFVLATIKIKIFTQKLVS